MTTHRNFVRICSLPAPAPGAFGPDHTAIQVISPDEWSDADPFILLMDDRLDGRHFAGPHPHAGFETVSFLVDGDSPAENQGERGLGPGDVEWTTTPDRPPCRQLLELASAECGVVSEQLGSDVARAVETLDELRLVWLEREQLLQERTRSASA